MRYVRHDVCYWQRPCQSLANKLSNATPDDATTYGVVPSDATLYARRLIRPPTVILTIQAAKGTPAAGVYTREVRRFPLRGMCLKRKPYRKPIAPARQPPPIRDR